MSVAENVLEMIVRLAKEGEIEQGGSTTASFDRDTPLFGASGLLDSLGLVSLVLALEQEIADRLGATVALADDKALSQKHSPFRTVGTLADYAVAQIETKRA